MHPRPRHARIPDGRRRQEPVNLVENTAGMWIHQAQSHQVLGFFVNHITDAADPTSREHVGEIEKVDVSEDGRQAAGIAQRVFSFLLTLKQLLVDCQCGIVIGPLWQSSD